MDCKDHFLLKMRPGKSMHVLADSVSLTAVNKQYSITACLDNSYLRSFRFHYYFF